jgi:hypothetical protein
MIQSQERTIGGTTYKVTQLGASTGLQLLVRLTKVLGPSIGELTKTGGANILDAKGDAVAGAIAKLAEHLTYEDLAHTCDVLGEFTEILNGAKAMKLTREARELHFAGNYGELMRWIVFALEVNFGSFFGASGLGAVLRRDPAPS